MTANLRELGPAIDPLALAARNPARYPHLLESTSRGASTAAHSIVFAFPGPSLALSNNGLSLDGKALPGERYLDRLDAWFAQERRSGSADFRTPFAGGWFLYLGYELAGEIEPSLSLPRARDGLPIALATRVPAAVIIDHVRNLTAIVDEAGDVERLDAMQADVHAVQQAWRNSPVVPQPDIDVEDLAEEDPARYLEGVRRILAYIREGDIFQANLSRAWQARLEGSGDALTLYARLRAANPAPFAALVRLEQAAIVSSSPERLVRARGGLVETRPIAGTRPRSASIARDEAHARELLAHPKERAEHIMLIDLERNDLGRVCRPGTVRVDELMTLETYSHVHHIVSNVRGVLRADITPGQVIAAVFPGGTITGCPKVRCMEILAELEAEGRGAYTGSVGYLGSDGDLDLNILIRSFTLSEDLLRFRAGAGIVADSIPEHELEETRAKAEGLLRAIGAGAMA
jgi:anthranilate synthase component 1